VTVGEFTPTTRPKIQALCENAVDMSQQAILLLGVEQLCIGGEGI